MRHLFYALAVLCFMLPPSAGRAEQTPATNPGIADIIYEGPSLLLTARGDVWGLGQELYNEGYPLPNYTTQRPYRPLFLFANVKKISHGPGHRAFVITNQGNLYGWGYNTNGAVLPDSKDRCITSPSFIMDKTTAVDGGYTYTLALRENGSLWTWGSLRDMPFGFRQQPKQIMSDVANFVVGETYVLVISNDGKLWHLDGPKADMLSPRLVLENVASCVAGRPPYPITNYALTRDGVLYRWWGEEAPASSVIHKVADGVTSIKGSNPFAYTTKDKKLWLIIKQDDGIEPYYYYYACFDPAAQVAEDIYFLRDNVADFYPSFRALLVKYDDGRLVGCSDGNMIPYDAEPEEGQDATRYSALILDLNRGDEKPMYILDDTPKPQNTPDAKPGNTLNIVTPRHPDSSLQPLFQ